MKRIYLPQITGKDDLQAFRQDVFQGMSKPKKVLPHRYSYMGEGGSIFQAVLQKGTNYYSLPIDQINLFKEQSKNIVSLLADGKFKVVDLGAGDGRKTKIIIQQALKKKCNFQYIPVDYSPQLAEDLSADLEKNYPNIQGTTLIGDMYQGMKWLNQNRKQGQKHVMMVLGGTFGNYEQEQIDKIMKSFSDQMKPGDIFGCTFWIMTTPYDMQNVYSNQCPDQYSFGQVFMSVFRKINKQLDADFDVKSLKNHSYYDPYRKYIVVCAVSQKSQTVTISGRKFNLEEGQAIELLISRRWTIKQAQQIVENKQLKLISKFLNQKKNAAFLCFQKQ